MQGAAVEPGDEQPAVGERVVDVSGSDARVDRLRTASRAPRGSWAWTARIRVTTSAQLRAFGPLSPWAVSRRADHRSDARAQPEVDASTNGGLTTRKRAGRPRTSTATSSPSDTERSSSARAMPTFFVGE